MIADLNCGYKVGCHNWIVDFVGRGLFGQAKGRKRLDNLYGFEAYGDDLADQAKNVLRIVGAVGVVSDAATLVG
jgi:hypothetical protein